MSNNYGGGYRNSVSASTHGGYYNSANMEAASMLGANNASCYFPSPPAKRVYCQPAPFTNALGMNYQRLVSGYGMSRPHY